MIRHSLRRTLGATLLSCTLTLTACAPATGTAPGTEPRVRAAPALPDLAWPEGPRAERWTVAAMSALQTHGKPLVETVPGDIETWCPGYEAASDAERAAFWAGLLSMLARYESTWNPRAVGGGGRWFGLVQIAPATARGYGCEARSGEALQDGAANLRCAIRIMAVTVLRDGVVAAGGGGVAADWGPFSSSGKRGEMAAWTRSQPFCAATRGA